jgi:hypothetical protein
MMVYNKSTSNIVNKAWEEVASFPSYNCTNESKWVQEVKKYVAIGLDSRSSVDLLYIWKKK